MGDCRVRWERARGESCLVGEGEFFFFFLNKKQKLFKDYFKAQFLW